MVSNKAFVIAAILSVSGAFAANAEGNAEAGEKVFKKCAACHVVDSGDAKVGPSLQNVIGRVAGTDEAFAAKYSPAIKEAGAGGLVWNDETIGQYLADPKGFIPKNKMAFAGLKKGGQPDETAIADVIAYLKQFSPAQ